MAPGLPDTRSEQRGSARLDERWRFMSKGGSFLARDTSMNVLNSEHADYELRCFQKYYRRHQSRRAHGRRIAFTNCVIRKVKSPVSGSPRGLFEREVDRYLLALATRFPAKNPKAKPTLPMIKMHPPNTIRAGLSAERALA